MKLHLTAQQLSFFSANGYIGFENLPLDLAVLKQEIDRHKGLLRDLWREIPLLENLAIRIIGPIVRQLVRRKELYLACDEWIGSSEPWDTSAGVQRTLSFQGLACVVCLVFDPKSPCFFMQPSSWPGMAPHWPKERRDCYLIAYGGADCLYIQNSNDLTNHYFKKFGFNYGDSIRKNPMIPS